MGENELVVGQPRLGWFIDGDDATPLVAAMLEDTGEQIVLSLPTNAHDDPYYRWFISDAHFGDDPDQSQFRYAPPTVSMLRDVDGPVVLVGCRASGHRERAGIGRGRIIANFAVLGATHLNYEEIDGMRTEIPALARWTGLRSVDLTRKTDEAGRVQSIQITLDAPPDIELSPDLHLRLHPSWRTSYPDNIGTFASHDVVQVQTRSASPVAWHEHTRMHQAVRELLAIAAWRPLGYQRIEVTRDDDPETFLSGDPAHPRWLPVMTHRMRQHEPWTSDPRFLFTFRDIGTGGVTEWLLVRKLFERTVRAMVSVADGHIQFVGERMLQAGIALEALGYQIDLNAGGQNLNSRGELPFPKALDIVLQNLVQTPLAEPLDWKARTIACYKAVKHPDKTEPDSLVLANTMRESLLVLRTWLAGRLGCEPTNLGKALEWDPMSQEYSQITY